MNQNALAKLDDEEAIAELASGVLSKEIAKRYGVSPYAIRKRLAKHPDYKQAIADQAESFVENATHEALSLDSDSDAVAIARARVKVDTAHKWAAARDPAKWGQRQQLDVNHTGQIEQVLQFDASSLLDKLRTVDVQSQHSQIVDATHTESDVSD